MKPLPSIFGKANLSFVYGILMTVLLFGCGRNNDDSKTGQSPAPKTKASQSHNPRIQRELDGLKSLVHQHVAPISEPAVNRRDWTLQTLRKSYAANARTDPKWDSAVDGAFVAFADYSRLGATEERFETLTNALAAATRAKCNDPMIQYMRARYGLEHPRYTPEQDTLDFLKAHEALWTSPYHPLFKFYGAFRAAAAARGVDPHCDCLFLYQELKVVIEDVANDLNAPPEEIFEAATLMLREFRLTKDPFWLQKLQPVLEKNWAREAGFFRLMGLAGVDRAWDARGGGYADTVPEQGWEEFRKLLGEAESHLTRAWQMDRSNAYTALLMMRVELGQGKGREREQEWFNRAMALEPDYLDAAWAMAYYLEPRWYGSEEETLEFARSCVASTNWGAHVALVLPMLHHSLAKYYKRAEAPEYWQRPQVWEDVRSAYEKFFRLNPEEAGYHHNYALDAYLCGRYAEFLAELRQFNNHTNYAYFGGEAKSRQMLARAKNGVSRR